MLLFVSKLQAYMLLVIKSVYLAIKRTGTFMFRSFILEDSFFIEMAKAFYNLDKLACVIV